MNKDFCVHIHGFKNLVEANEFCRWYSNQGEQDIDVWLGCRQDEGMDVRTHISCESIVIHPLDDCVVMHVG